jgi:hypothetical protein
MTSSTWRAFPDGNYFERFVTNAGWHAFASIHSVGAALINCRTFHQNPATCPIRSTQGAAMSEAATPFIHQSAPPRLPDSQDHVEGKPATGTSTGAMLQPMTQVTA